MPATSSETMKQRVRYELRTRSARVRKDFFQSLQIVVSVLVAYIVSEKVLGHHQPIFAATAAIV